MLLPDEGRYVGIAWEMLRSNDWLTPTLDGMPYFHKPPLFYWITAASMHIFGNSDGVARAAPWSGATLGMVALFLFARRWSVPKIARFAVLALVCHPLYFLAAQYANMDMLEAGLITAAVLSFADAMLRVEQGLPHRLSLHLGYLFCGLGVMTKGLIGLVLPALIILTAIASSRRWAALRPMLSVSGLVLFCLITLPWFIMADARHPGALRYVIVVQHWSRYFGSGFNNVRPPWFFPAVLLLLSLPWLPWYRPLAKRLRGGEPAEFIRILMLAWIVVVVGFFSLPESKMLGYILPVVPPLAFLAADGFASSATRGSGLLWLASLTLGVIVSLSVLLFVPWRDVRSNQVLATALRQQYRPSEPVFMIERFDFDVPRYAGLESQVYVVSRWDDPQWRRMDNWRRELLDARDFHDGDRSQALINYAEFEARACIASGAWVIAELDDVADVDVLKKATLISEVRRVGLWRLMPRDCTASGSLTH